ncbi:hypothetical protein EXIGLDRAFT_831754 [Exidia glandulosa HHB12029]|uniref:Uncharacterized protein n=1 Tax=Exidia glandulosa HHB12029 TaxID=1314781 RepID=A0A165M9Y5_EXIGL|nr:hypothetical protein EXIGLDRAFT_831754 [Exidia glandulosa HHB12029]
MASTSRELVVGPSSGLIPSPAVSSSAMTLSSTGSGPFLEGSPSSLFWRPDDSNDEGPAPLEEIQREDERLHAQHSPPQPSLLEALETRYPSSPSSLRARDSRSQREHVGLGIGYQRDRDAVNAGAHDMTLRADVDGVSVDALLADDGLTVPRRQWWPKGSNKVNSNRSLPISVGYTSSSGQVTPEPIDYPSQRSTGASLDIFDLDASLAPVNRRSRHRAQASLPTIAGSPSKGIDVGTGTSQRPLFSPPAGDLEESPSRHGRSMSGPDHVSPGQWVKRESADMILPRRVKRDSGVDITTPAYASDWMARYRILPPPPRAVVSTSPQKNIDMYTGAPAIETLIASSSNATDSLPVTPRKPSHGLTINVYSPMSPMSPTSPTSIMLIPSRHQQEQSVPPLSARSSHFSIISNMSTRRGQRNASRMSSSAHLRSTSATPQGVPDFTPKYRTRPTARTLFLLGFIAPWCWLIGGWYLDRSGGTKRPAAATPHIKRSSKDKQGRTVWNARHLAPTPDIDEMMQVNAPSPVSMTNPAGEDASPILPAAPHSTPAMAAESADPWQACAREPRESDLELAGLRPQPRDPWVLRCRIAAALSAVIIVSGCTVAIVVALRANVN